MSNPWEKLLCVDPEAKEIQRLIEIQYQSWPQPAIEKIFLEESKLDRRPVIRFQYFPRAQC